MFRSGQKPSGVQVVQPTELSREQQHKLVQSFCLGRRQNPLAESASQGLWLHLERPLCPSQYPRAAYPLLSSLLGGREMRRSGWPREGWIWTLGDEGGRKRAICVPFLPPASLRPSNPGGWGRVNSTCLLLIKPWPAIYGVASRAVLGSQEHFREQRFHQREEKQSRDCALEIENRQ